MSKRARIETFTAVGKTSGDNVDKRGGFRGLLAQA